MARLLVSAPDALRWRNDSGFGYHGDIRQAGSNVGVLRPERIDVGGSQRLRSYTLDTTTLTTAEDGRPVWGQDHIHIHSILLLNFYFLYESLQIFLFTLH